jgi:hypothetical protein
VEFSSDGKVTPGLQRSHSTPRSAVLPQILFLLERIFIDRTPGGNASDAQSGKLSTTTTMPGAEGIRLAAANKDLIVFLQQVLGSYL